MHQEIMTLRQTLKTAIRHGWLDHPPAQIIAEISHRAWFSRDEYRRLYQATRKRAREPKRARFKWESEQLHDYVLFSANTGLRPDEARRLQFRDVTIVEDGASGQTILEIEARGKRGVGYYKSMSGAVQPFERLKSRLHTKRPDDAGNDGNGPKQIRTGPKSGAFRDPTDLISSHPRRGRSQIRP